MIVAKFFNVIKKYGQYSITKTKSETIYLVNTQNV